MYHRISRKRVGTGDNSKANSRMPVEACGIRRWRRGGLGKRWQKATARREGLEKAAAGGRVREGGVERGWN